jgi:DNA-directed RNA polymerase subunit RPC12/RpoP
MPTLLLVPLILGVFLLAAWMARAYEYHCPECGEWFQTPILGQFTTLNMGNERRVRCPRCGKRSWVKTFRKKARNPPRGVG